MSKDEDRIYELIDILYDKVHDLVDVELANESLELSEQVRLIMTEQFRFFKRLNEK